MKCRALLLLALTVAIGFSACSNEARYRRYVKASIRDKEKQQKKIRKDIARQNREMQEKIQDSELGPPRVTVQ